MSQGAQSMAFLMFLSAIPILGVSIYTFRNRSKPGGRGLLLCLVGMIGWSLMLLFATWPTRVLPVHLNVAGRFFFQLFVTFGWPLFVWEYLRRERVQIRRWVLAVVLVVPVITVSLAVTNPIHHLVLDSATPTNPIGISEYVVGPWYFIHIAFASVFAMLPIGLLIADFRGAHGVHRQQLLLLIAGWAIGFPGALLTHLLRNIESVPLYVDVTPMSFAVTSLLWGLALGRYQLFNLVPVSRRRAIESLSDPVITTDQFGVVVDMNVAATDVFGTDVDPIGASFAELSQPYPELHALIADDETPAEVTLTANGDTRRFVPQVQTITRGKLPAGRLYVLQDVTRLREREAELELLNEVLTRVFRHNIRNRLNVIEGYATQIEAQDASDTYTTEVTRIREATRRVISHSEKAAVLRELINDDRGQQPIDLSKWGRGQGRYLEQNGLATVETDIEDGVRVLSHPLITVAIEELVDNALEHHDGPSPPNISIEVRSEGSMGVVHIEDDGPGIDPNELEALDSGEETDLTHGSGVGLWLVDIITRKSNGSLSVARAADGEGTQATVRLPIQR